MSHGMPHFGCEYKNGKVNSHALLEGAYCAVCGKPAQHAHHEPPRGIGGGNSYRELSGVKLKPALIALCAHCHHDRHSAGLTIEWHWTDKPSEEEWESGWPLKVGFPPHSELLYDLGRWEFYNNGELIQMQTKPPCLDF